MLLVHVVASTTTHASSIFSRTWCLYQARTIAGSLCMYTSLLLSWFYCRFLKLNTWMAKKRYKMPWNHYESATKGKNILHYPSLFFRKTNKLCLVWYISNGTIHGHSIASMHDCFISFLPWRKRKSWSIHISFKVSLCFLYWCGSCLYSWSSSDDITIEWW